MHILYLVSVVLVCCCRHWHFTHPILLPLHPWFKGQNFFFFFFVFMNQQRISRSYSIHYTTLQDESLKTWGSGFSSHRRLSFTMEAVFQARLKISSSAFWNMPFVDDICGISAPFHPRAYPYVRARGTAEKWVGTNSPADCSRLHCSPFADWRRITSHYFCFWSLLNMLLTALVKRLMCC